jgi:hypothetical protein
MLLTDTYRFLEDDERILAGDQFKMGGLSDDHWAPVEDFVGHRPREFCSALSERVQFRRLIVREVVV